MSDVTTLAAAIPIGRPDVSIAHSRRAPYVFAITIMTVCYLVLELGFNARLLDVTGGHALPEEISALEKWGRVISGVAFTLAVWGTFLMPRAHRNSWPLPKLLTAMAIAAAICCSTAYFGEKRLIDHVVDTSDGQHRRAAAQLAAVSAALLDGTVTLDGIDLSAGQLASPAGKSFLALFPMIALSTDDLDAKAKTGLRTILRRDVTKTLGTAEASYNNAFIPSARAIKDSFDSYVDGEKSFNRALAEIPDRQQKAWADYLMDMNRAGVSPTRVPVSYWGQVEDAVRKRGIDVPLGWNPADKASFDRAIGEKIVREATAAFKSATSKAVGAPLPMGLDLASFVAQPPVQARWKRELHSPEGVTLTMGMGLAAYRMNVYEPAVERAVEVKVAELLLPTETYADGGRLAYQGRRAMEGLVVPPIALAFSIIGALVHVFKSTRYASILIAPGWRLRTPIILAAVVAIAVSAFWLPNAVTSARVFRYFDRQTAEKLGAPTAVASQWVIQAQLYFYPVNEFVRTRLLMGYGFGYEPERSRGRMP